MQRAQFTAQHRGQHRDHGARTVVRPDTSFVQTISKDTAVPTANMGGLMFNDNQPPRHRPYVAPSPTRAAGTLVSPPPPRPAQRTAFDISLCHKLHRIFFAAYQGKLHNTLTDTHPAVLVPSSACPIPMSELKCNTISFPHKEGWHDTHVFQWDSPLQLEQALRGSLSKPYVLALPRHAVLLRRPVPKDLPENCDLLVMGTLRPEFPCEGSALREIHRTSAHASCWWCPHMGVFYGRAEAVQKLHGRGLHVAREWLTEFHHKLQDVAHVDQRCTLFQDLSLAPPLVEGLPLLKSIDTYAEDVSLVIYSTDYTQGACRAACQYHSLGYTDVTVCYTGASFPSRDVPWAKVYAVDNMDGCLLHAALSAHPAVLIHTDHIVPSPATLQKLHQHWTRAPHCIHSLLGSCWKDGCFEPIDVTQATVACEIIDPSCFILNRTSLSRYFELIIHARSYHAMTRSQFVDVALSWTLPPPHQAHPRLCATLECNAPAKAPPHQHFHMPELEETIYDAWLRVCSKSKPLASSSAAR